MRDGCLHRTIFTHNLKYSCDEQTIETDSDAAAGPRSAGGAGRPEGRLPCRPGRGVRGAARLCPDLGLLVLAFGQCLEGGRGERPRSDETGGDQPCLHRQYRPRGAGDALCPRETFYGRMVGSDPCGAQTRLRAGHRDRHVQQPRLEPGRRAVDRTRAGHALPGFGQGACPGRREGRGGAAAPVGRFPGRAGGRLSRSRRGACGADGGRYACDGCRHGCRGARPHRRRPGDGAPLRWQPRSRHRLGDGRRHGSAQHHGVARPPSDTCRGRIAGEGDGRLPDNRIVRDRPLEPQYRGRLRPLRPGFGQRGEDHGARVPAHSPRCGEGYGFRGSAALVATPCGALCGEDLCQDVPVAAALLGGVPVARPARAGRCLAGGRPREGGRHNGMSRR